MIVLPAPASSASRKRSGLLQHVVVDGDPLVRQRVDLRDLGGEGRVEEVAEGEPLALGEHADRVCEPVKSVTGGATDSAWPSTGAESSSSNFRICDHASGDGFVCPFSQRFTVTNETPSRAASSTCVSPSRPRNCLMRTG